MQFENCTVFIAAIDAKFTEPWSAVIVAYTASNATDLNPLLYCLATSGNEKPGGLYGYGFYYWTGEDTVLDQ